MQKLLGAITLSLFFVTGLFAQQTQLNGTVTDPSGAVIPNATISIVNVSTGAQRETTSDTQGRYIMPQLTPGTYKLIAKSAGFADVTINNLELLVNQPATVPITFEKLGATSTTISVEAAAQQVNTTDASLGNAINTQQIVQMPSFARNVAALLAFQPGVTNNGNTPSSTGSGALNGSVNGGKPDQANVTLDGVDVNDQNQRNAFTSVLRVTLDSVQEFRTTTINGNANEGRSSGAQIALVTKSGTNTLHGSLYEYRRGTETAANDYFLNLAGQKTPVLLINIFGGSAGGPIKKNRAFYFINYEGRRDASATSVTRTVPSDLLRSGILQYRTTTGAIKQMDAAAIKAQDPAGIGINPASMAVFNLYPHSNDNTLGDNLNFVGYRFTAPQHQDQNTYIARFDYNLDQASKHQLFFRGQLQNDSQGGTPQFPGQPPSFVNLNNSKGLAIGYTAALKSNLLSTTRYGFTRQGAETTGVQSAGASTFRSLSTIFALTNGVARIIPVHFISQDFAWNHGAHDVRIGATLRWISNSNVGGTAASNHSFSSASTNVSWLLGTGKDLQPADLNSTFRTAYGDAMAATIGILPQGTANYNYLVDGSVLAPGQAIARKFNNEEYEWYAQDTWRVTRALTITAGVRHSLMPPIYEANGQQTSTNVSIGDWFYTRANLASVGAPQSLAPAIQYILAGTQGARDLYPNHLLNFAPRLAMAYSPQGTDGLSKFLFGGPGKTSIRAGWGMFYDLIGQPLAQTYAASAFGFATTITNPSSSETSITAPRFTGFYNLPARLIAPAPKGGFPALQPNNFAITNSIDDTLLPPYTMNMNFTIGREFGHGLFIQGSYVGRLSRRSLINKDLAMPTNLVDAKSGMTYFQAASALATQIAKNVPVSQVQKLSFWEDLWPGLADPAKGLTATQGAYNKYSDYAPDYTSALVDIDVGCTPSCSVFGPNEIFNKQFSALSAWSSVGKGAYHAMQWTVRKRFSAGLTFDFNYTWGKSEDLASAQEGSGSFNGFLLNPWFPRQFWAVSNYDSTHIVNSFAQWQIPVGKGRRFLANSNRLVDGILGGWQLTPTYSQSSGTPVAVGDGRNWPTNWNITGNATQIAPVSTSTTKNAPAVAGTGGPNLFADPKAALNAYAFTVPGESGNRNNLRSQGPFVINLGVAKNFNLFTLHDNPHVLQFRWETFNLTNTARFSPTSLSLDLGTTGTFGKYSSVLGGPRQMQFALRYEF